MTARLRTSAKLRFLASWALAALAIAFGTWVGHQALGGNWLANGGVVGRILGPAAAVAAAAEGGRRARERKAARAGGSPRVFENEGGE